MTRATKKFLTTLRKQLLEAKQEDRQQIWDILTALRGPDDQNTETKAATTELIRGKVLGKKVGNRVGMFANISHKDTLSAKNTRRLSNYNHFESHAKKAFTALAILWNTVNDEFTK